MSEYDLSWSDLFMVGTLVVGIFCSGAVAMKFIDRWRL